MGLTSVARPGQPCGSTAAAPTVVCAGHEPGGWQRRSRSCRDSSRSSLRHSIRHDETQQQQQQPAHHGPWRQSSGERDERHGACCEGPGSERVNARCVHSPYLASRVLLGRGVRSRRWNQERRPGWSQCVVASVVVALHFAPCVCLRESRARDLAQRSRPMAAVAAAPTTETASELNQARRAFGAPTQRSYPAGHGRKQQIPMSRSLLDS